MTLLSSVGGAAGPLYGGFFLALSKASAGKEKLNKAGVGRSTGRKVWPTFKSAARLSWATRPWSTRYRRHWTPIARSPTAILSDAMQAAVEQAHQSAEATIPLQARKGRASYLAERSIGHQDPGATSSWLLLQALASACEAGS